VKLKNIYDAYTTKYWAIKFATDAAATILKIDQVRQLTFIIDAPYIFDLILFFFLKKKDHYGQTSWRT